MYCWNIEALKRDLHNDSLGEKAKFLYMLFWVVFLEFLLEVFANMSFQEGMSSSVWDWGFSAAVVLISAIGTIMAFKANGGSDGHDFLGKYFSIGFVVGVRLFPLSILLLLGGLGIFASLVLYVPDWVNTSLMTSVASGVPTILITVWMYWRICKHIKDIRVGKVIDVDTRKRSSLPFYILAMSLFVPFIAISAFAVMSLLNAPYSYVISGGDISAAQYNELQYNEIIAVDENIVLFYSGGKRSILEEGSILTEERVISYYKDTDDLEIYIDSASYEEIQKIILYQEGINLLRETTLHIYLADENVALFLDISAEQAGDDRFIEMLENKTGLTVQYSWEEKESESVPSDDVDAPPVDDVKAAE